MTTRHRTQRTTESIHHHQRGEVGHGARSRSGVVVASSFDGGGALLPSIRRGAARNGVSSGATGGCSSSSSSSMPVTTPPLGHRRQNHSGVGGGIFGHPSCFNNDDDNGSSNDSNNNEGDDDVHHHYPNHHNLNKDEEGRRYSAMIERAKYPPQQPDTALEALNCPAPGRGARMEHMKALRDVGTNLRGGGQGRLIKLAYAMGEYSRTDRRLVRRALRENAPSDVCLALATKLPAYTNIKSILGGLRFTGAETNDVSDSSADEAEDIHKFLDRCNVPQHGTGSASPSSAKPPVVGDRSPSRGGPSGVPTNLPPGMTQEEFKMLLRSTDQSSASPSRHPPASERNSHIRSRTTFSFFEAHCAAMHLCVVGTPLPHPLPPLAEKIACSSDRVAFAAVTHYGFSFFRSSLVASRHRDSGNAFPTGFGSKDVVCFAVASDSTYIFAIGASSSRKSAAAAVNSLVACTPIAGEGCPLAQVQSVDETVWKLTWCAVHGRQPTGLLIRRPPGGKGCVIPEQVIVQSRMHFAFLRVSDGVTEFSIDLSDGVRYGMGSVRSFAMCDMKMVCRGGRLGPALDCDAMPDRNPINDEIIRTVDLAKPVSSSSSGGAHSWRRSYEVSKIIGVMGLGAVMTTTKPQTFLTASPAEVLEISVAHRNGPQVLRRCTLFSPEISSFNQLSLNPMFAGRVVVASSDGILLMSISAQGEVNLTLVVETFDVESIA